MSDNVISVIAVIEEVTPGTRPTMDASATGIEIIDSPLPLQIERASQPRNVQRLDFAKTKPRQTTKQYVSAFTTPMAGSGTPGTTPRWMPVATSGGWKNTNTPADKDVMKLATGLSNGKTMTVLNEYGSEIDSANERWCRESNYHQGNARIVGNLTQGVRIIYAGRGKYLAPVQGRMHDPAVLNNGTAWAPPTSNDDEALISVTNDEVNFDSPSAGNNYKPCVQSIDINPGAATQDIFCMNAGTTGGLRNTRRSDINAVMLVSFLQDPASTAVISDAEWQAAINAEEEQTLQWKWTDASDDKMGFSITNAVPIGFSESKQGVVTVTQVSYLLVGLDPITITLSATGA